MNREQQTTIRNPVRFSHFGFLTGCPTGIRLAPAKPDTGIVFNRTVPARLAHVFMEDHFVGLRRGRKSVLGVEHLLAACYGLGIDNLRVEVTGGEVPFGDGSALPFLRILRAAGIHQLAAPRRVQSLTLPVVVHRDESFICALPAEPNARLDINCFIRFPEPAVGEQSYAGAPSGESFCDEVGPARTFGYLTDGRSLPVWLRRTCQVADRMVVPSRPRYPNEPARHKTLDLLGDLALLGRRLQARVFAYKTGHRLHHELLRRLEETWTSTKS